MISMSKFKGLGVPVEKPARMYIMHPVTNEPVVDKSNAPAYVDVYSADSDRARACNRKVTQKRLDMRGRNAVSAVALENDGYGLLAELTAGWHLVDINTGEPIDVPCTTQNARELYSEPEMSWLREQVDVFAGARGNFLKPSANSSATMQSESLPPSES
jgi:hypothetical protein